MRTILVVPDPQLRQDLLAALTKFPEIEVIRDLELYPEPNDFLRIVRSRRPDFVFISAQDFTRFQGLVSALDERMPGISVISVARDADPLLLIPKLMHLGLREFLSSPISREKLAEALASIAQQLAKHPTPLALRGDLYAFFPARPGVGTSTLAVSASCALADDLHVHTLLLDCDLMAGVTKFLLKIGNSSSIVDAMDHADALDEDLWSQMVGHWNGLDVLHAGELTPPATLTAASFEIVLSFARSQYDTICADLASSLDPFTIQVLQEARRIFLVTTPELVSLYMAADRLRHFKDLGLADKVSLLLNRKNQWHHGLSEGEASQLVGIPIAQQFSNDYVAVQGAILNGVAVSHRSDLGQSIMALAQSIAPASSPREAALPVRHRKFLEFFHVPSAPDKETVWKD